MIGRPISPEFLFGAKHAALDCRHTDVASWEAHVHFGAGEDRATAWYNLACVAGLAGQPIAAAKALRTGAVLLGALRHRSLSHLLKRHLR